MSSNNDDDLDLLRFQELRSKSNPATPKNSSSINLFSSNAGGVTPVGGVPTPSVSELAAQRRIERERNHQIELLQKKLESAEYKNLELTKQKKKLTDDNDSLKREVKFYEKQFQDAQAEIQSLRQQLEATLRIVQANTSTGKNDKYSSLRDSVSNNSVLNTTNQAMTELKSIKDQLQTQIQLNKTLKEEKDEAYLQIKVLKDALSYRSEEIGLSGHADLLYKIAQLRGEVTSLKNELQNKESNINDLAQVKKEEEELNLSLNEQIENITKKLGQSQQELYRLSNSDLGQLLKSAEKERDLLMEYVQKDMKQQVSISHQLEETEREYRLIKKREETWEKKERDLQQHLQTVQDQLSLTETELNSVKASLSEKNELIESLLQDKADLLKNNTKLNVKNDESSRVEANLYSQLKEKDIVLLKKSEEIVTLKTKIQEYELSTPSLVNENKHLKDSLTTLEAENRQLRSRVMEVEPKLEVLSPQLSDLQNELQKVNNEKKTLKIKIQSLEPLHQQFDEFKQEIEKIESEGPSTANSSLTLSQKHTLWVSSPSLRHFLPFLYNKIRQLLHDLHVTESSLTSANQAYQALQVQSESQNKIYEDKIASLYQTMKSLQESKIDQEEKIENLSEYQTNYKELQLVLQQIRGAFMLYPSKLYKFVKNKDEIKEEEIAINIEEITDSNLPNFINELLLVNSQTSNILKDILTQLSDLQKDHTNLNSEYQSLLSHYNQVEEELKNLTNKNEELTEKLVSSERRYLVAQSDTEKNLQESSNLLEQQNNFISALEAKIEQVNRENKLNNAQLVAFFQREEKIRAIVHKGLEKARYYIPINLRHEKSSLIDLISYVIEQIPANNIEQSSLLSTAPPTSTITVGTSATAATPSAPTASSSSTFLSPTYSSTPVGLDRDALSTTRRSTSVLKVNTEDLSASKGQFLNQSLPLPPPSTATAPVPSPLPLPSPSPSLTASSSSQALQERLRKAQMAFAAFRVNDK